MQRGGPPEKRRPQIPASLAVPGGGVVGSLPLRLCLGGSWNWKRCSISPRVGVGGRFDEEIPEHTRGPMILPQLQTCLASNKSSLVTQRQISRGGKLATIT